VERRLQHHAVKGQLARGEAAVRFEDFGRDLGIDEAEYVNV
jgi:hypothetical protein